jgi:hypothetical protein
MSNQMVEDLRAYLEGGPESVGETPELIVASPPSPTPPAAPSPRPPSSPALAGSLVDQAIQVLEARCASCHAATDGNRRASKKWPGMDRLDLLTGKYVAGNTPTDKQELWYILTDPDDPMPPENADTGPLTKPELDVLRRWIADGAPRQEQAKVAHIDQQALLKTVMNDLIKLGRHRRADVRYFTLTNLHNVARDIPHMDTYRVALAKTLNSLSQRRDLLIPVAIDPQQTIYRIHLDDLDWPESHWEELLAIYPYGLLDEEERIGDVVSGLTSSRLPIIRADWFVFAATQPPLYGKLLGHGPRLEHLDEQLGLDRNDNIRRHRIARAGFVSSGVSANNRLIERHETRYGAYWISYDFKSNDGKSDLLANPLGPGSLFHSARAFDHAGGEVIYSLPNGLQGYYLAEADGSELFVGPADIVYDDSNPRGGVIVNGISCISCHAQGMRRGTDDIRQHVLANRAHFRASERRIIEDIHPESADMDRLLTRDAAQFRAAMTSLISGMFAGDSARAERALASAGLIPGKSAESVEPVRALFDRFIEPLDLETAASSLGFTGEQLKAQAAGAPTLYSMVGRLERTGVARDKYLATFQKLAGDLGLEIRHHQRAEFPIFNHSLRPSTGVPLLDKANPNSAFRVQIDTEDGRRSYREGKEFRLKVRANRDCFITLVTVDPSGDMLQLVPSAAIAVEQLRANQSVLLPSELKLIVAPPHGRSLMRVIATTRRLQVAAHRSVAHAPANASVVALGKAPAYDGTRNIRVKGSPRPTGNRVIRVSDRPRPAATPAQFIPNNLSQFSPEEWTTADLVLETHP